MDQRQTLGLKLWKCSFRGQSIKKNGTRNETMYRHSDVFSNCSVTNDNSQ